MFVSIIVPAYHIKPYLCRCIESIVFQDFMDCEVIIVDDGSTDGTGELADSIKEKYSSFPIKVIHQENRGLGGARNTGVENATGDYVLFVDGDDMLAPGSLNILKNAIKNNPVDVLCFNFIGLSERKLKAIKNEPIHKVNESENVNVEIISQKDYLLSTGVTAWSKLYRRSFFLSSQIFFPQKILYEDIATTPKVVLYTENIGRIKNTIYYYIYRGGSIISSPQHDRIFEIFDGYDGVLNLFDKLNKKELFMDELEWNAILHCYYYTLIRSFHLGLPDKKTIRKIEEYLKVRFPDFAHNRYLQISNVENKKILDCINKRYLSVALRKYGRHYVKIYSIRTINTIKNLFRGKHKNGISLSDS